MKVVKRVRHYVTGVHGFSQGAGDALHGHVSTSLAAGATTWVKMSNTFQLMNIYILRVLNYFSNYLTRTCIWGVVYHKNGDNITRPLL